MIIINRYRLFWLSITIIFISYVIFAFPIKIHKELPAVKYRLGDEEIIEHTTIEVDGYYNRRLFSDDYFTGLIYIEGYEFTKESSGFSNLKSTLTNINFDKNKNGMYKYIINKSGAIEHLMQGEIFIKDKFSVITMTIMEKDILDSTRSGWSSEDGLMIAAPAQTRGEALDISNLLMGDTTKGNLLK